MMMGGTASCSCQIASRTTNGRPSSWCSITTKLVWVAAGTARILQESEDAEAFAALAMGLTALEMAVLLRCCAPDPLVPSTPSFGLGGSVFVAAHESGSGRFCCKSRSDV